MGGLGWASTKNIPLITVVEDNNLSILTSSIFDIKDMEKSKIDEMLRVAEEETAKDNISDQAKYLIDQKIEVLRTIN